jgi:hypothetical protein
MKNLWTGWVADVPQITKKGNIGSSQLLRPQATATK